MKCPRFDNYPGKSPELFEPAYPLVQIVAPEMAAYNARCALLPVAEAARTNTFTPPRISRPWF